MSTTALHGIWEMVRAESGGEPSNDLLALRAELHLTASTYHVHFAGELADCGVRRVNVSLDTLDADKFRAITRWGEIDKVLAGIEAARAAGLAVLMNAGFSGMKAQFKRADASGARYALIFGEDEIARGDRRTVCARHDEDCGESEGSSRRPGSGHVEYSSEGMPGMNAVGRAATPRRLAGPGPGPPGPGQPSISNRMMAVPVWTCAGLDSLPLSASACRRRGTVARSG